MYYDTLAFHGEGLSARVEVSGSKKLNIYRSEQANKNVTFYINVRCDVLKIGIYNKFLR